METAQVLKLIDEQRARFDAALERISHERLTAPGAEGAWRAKDILAHITWSEREMVGVLRQRAMIGSELWRLSQDERNATVYTENRERPLGDVLEDARLSDAEMNDPALIAHMPNGLEPWRLLAGTTWR